MRSPILAGTLVFAAALVAACGGGATSTAAPAATSAPATEAPAPTTAPATEAGGGSGAAAAAAIALGETSLGQVLVDGDGRTIYMFTADTGGTSACYDACAQSWPPVLGTAEAGAGLDASLFGTTERTDGTTQVTFNGMPLYLFAGDAAAGDVKGQGLNDKWYVLAADGSPVK